MKKVKATFTKENTAKIIFGICAVFSIIAVVAIIGFVFLRSIPALREIGIIKFISGKKWIPRWEDSVLEGKRKFSDIFGISTMLATSVLVTVGSVLFGGIFGIFTAIFLAYYCPKNLENTPFFKKIPFLKKLPLKGIFEQIINLLASIPSIVLGFFGLVVIVPLMLKISGGAGDKGVLAAVIILSIMIMPTIASLSKNSLEALSREYYEGSLALGNSKDQTVFRVMFPAAKSGILSAVILGVGRAIGETMAVMMVLGGASGKFPSSLFLPVGSLTTTIAQEMGDVAIGSIHESALFAIGLILLLICLLVNFLLSLVKKERIGGNKLFGGKIKEKAYAEKVYVYKKQGISQTILKYISILLSLFIAFILVYLVVHLCVKGIPYINLHFLFGERSASGATLLPAFVSTGMIIFMTLLISLPIGIGAAIYLNEYSKKGSKLVKTIRLFIDTLSGVPSIVFGLFGMILFVRLLGLGYSLWAGSFTMVLIVLPTIIRSTEESLKEVPNSMREGSLALGAGKLRTIFKIVLPAALRGIVTSIILSIGRIVGESAALIFTSGATVEMPMHGYNSAGSTFSVFMYYFQMEGMHMNEMYATAVVLIFIVLVLDILVSVAQKYISNKTTGAKDKPKKQSQEKIGYDGKVIRETAQSKISLAKNIGEK